MCEDVTPSRKAPRRLLHKINMWFGKFGDCKRMRAEARPSKEQS